MKKTKGLLLLVLTMVVFFTIKNEALAANSLERSYYTVVSGTATKLGTQESENLKGNIYLEEWEVPKEMVLAEDVAEVLLKSSNVGELPIEIDKLEYSTLKKLAETAAEKKIGEQCSLNQGYAQLGLAESKKGYTYGILIIKDEATGNDIVTGYYADLSQKGIYKIELTCKKSSSSEIFKVKAQDNKSSNDSSNDESSSNITEEIPIPPPAPPVPPVPPPPPGGPIDDDPTPPTPVIPGPTEG